jgi:S1-C subfamily serine protease
MLLLAALLALASGCRGKGKDGTGANGSAAASGSAALAGPQGRPLGAIALATVSVEPAEFELDEDALLQIAILAGSSSLPIRQTPEGLRVELAAPESVIERAGLRAGDLITRINGAATGGGAWIETAYEALRRTDAIVLQVRRDGAEQSLRYRLRRSTPSLSPPDAPDAGPEGVARIDDRTVEVSRAVVDGMLADPSRLMRQVRVVPAVRDGKTVGVKLFGIRSKSMVSALGIKNGDLLLSIDGVSTTDPDGMLERYATLRAARSLTLELERNGQRIKLLIRVTESPAP